MQQVIAPVACACALGASQALGAFSVVDDRSFFDGVEHTFLDFESRGDGVTPVGLCCQEIALMPEDEYSKFGVTFSEGMKWGNAPPPQISPADPYGGQGDAVKAAGSWPTVIGGPEFGFSIEFHIPVRSFGLAVVQQGFPSHGAPDPIDTTTITAFNTNGDVLGVMRFWLDVRDGGFGKPYTYVDTSGEEPVLKEDPLWKQMNFGFMGLTTDEPIARLVFSNSRDTAFDDLHFSALPAPGAGAALVLAALGMGLRRRR